MKEALIKSLKYIVICLSVIAASACLWAQEDDGQSNVRENPNIVDCDSVHSVQKIEYPSYINLDANHIDLNGDDWEDLCKTLSRAGEERVSIVHIGDSHLQADMATAVVRRRLGERFGSAGRGLIVPFKLAGTNEPSDYAIKSNAEVSQARLLKTPWPVEMGFTGIGVKPAKKQFELSFWALEPFDSIAVYFNGECDLRVDSLDAQYAKGLTAISLTDTCSAITLNFESEQAVSIHGINLIRGNKGVNYHVIGNNGATYGTYNGVKGFERDVAALEPSLIIISLGTNEAFGRTTDAELRTQMRTMIQGLRRECPGAKFLITTPAECQRRTYRGKGRNRRRAGFAINMDVKRLRNAIIEFGKAEGIAVYDFYAVAGGDGSSSKWLNDGKMNRDRIHLLKPGYMVQGHLLADALLEKFEN